MGWITKTIAAPFKGICDAITKAVQGAVGTLYGLALLLLGLAGILLSAYAAFLLPAQIMAIPVASGGSIVGTCFITLAFRKLAAERSAGGGTDIESRIRKEVEFEYRAKELEQGRALLEEENARLEAEKERLASQRIEVNACQRVMKLGLAEYNATITDFSRKEVKRQEGGWLSNEKMTEYVGVLQYSFVALLGVDLSKVRFREIDGKAIRVSGLCPEYQGKRKDMHRWKFRELRGSTMAEGKAKDTCVLPEDGRLREESEEQLAVLLKSIDNGSQFRELNTYILSMAKELIRILLHPLNREIIHAEDGEDVDDGDTLVTFLEKHNFRIDKRMESLRERQTGIRLLLEHDYAQR